MRELLASMDSVELSEWLAWDHIHGLSDPHQGSALVAYTVAAVNGSKATFDDFLPRRKPKPRQTAADMQRNLSAFASAHNAKFKRG